MSRAIPKVTRTRLRSIWDRALYRSRLRRETNADARRFRRAAQSIEASGLRLTPTQLQAQITRDYHRIEKGLALPAPKRPFGDRPMDRLDHYLPQAIAQFPDAQWVRAGVVARDGLKNWNADGSVDERVAPRSYEATSENLFEARHSVRDFEPVPVPMELLQQAVRLASYAPSVCNREPWRIYFFSGTDVPRVLAHQNGNAGFRQVVPTVALVSVELGHFVNVGERNQPFIEGGIFGASFVYALQSLGLGSCMLNLSLTTDRLDALRNEVAAPQSEVLCMMIAIGYPRSGHRHAASVRRPLEDIIARE